MFKTDLYGHDKTYSRPIYKLMKCIDPDLTIGTVAMNIMNSFVKDIMQRISAEASELVLHSKRATMISNDIKSAAKLVIKTDELRTEAVEMAELVEKYIENQKRKRQEEW